MDLFYRHDARGQVLPIVASLPHSGEFVPDDIAVTFDPRHRRWLPDTDWFLPDVYAFLPDLGITTLEATHSRYVADLNRDPSRALYGSFFEAVVAERSAEGAPVYATQPAADELGTRVARYHEPYQREIARLLQERIAQFSRVLLLDLHSYMIPDAHEVCLGDARGAACPPAITAMFEQSFRKHGFDTVTNTPYTGGYIVRSHGLTPGVSALQIEIRYPLYMDCARIDEPERPVRELARITSLKTRLSAALESALRAYIGN